MRGSGGAITAIFLAAGACLMAGSAAAQSSEPRHPCADRALALAAKFKIGKGATMPAAIAGSLTGRPGDPERGEDTMIARDQGDCLACHHVAKILRKADESDPESVAKYGNHGEVGPPLNGVGGRFSEGELRLILVDPRMAFPDMDPAMPAYHSLKDMNGVERACRRRVILSAQAIEDIVAYLKELK